MDVMYLLIPLSVLLVLFIVGVLGWAIHAGQLDDLEREGGRILEDEAAAAQDKAGEVPELDADQGGRHA